MKKTLAFLLLLGVMTGGGAVAPAKADSFSFSISSGDGYGPYHGGGRQHGWKKHHSHWRPVHAYGPIIYSPPPPVYLRPTPTVVYETTVVQQPVRYVPESALVAHPVSDAFTNERGQYCREYQSTARVGGRPSPVYGTACLQPDGAWRVVE